MGEESWFTAEETVENGLADEVVKPSKSDQPEDRATLKFAGRLQAAVAAAEAVAEETEKVVTFRVSQGKPPLSEDAVALLEQLTAATGRLVDAVASEPEEILEDLSTQDEVDAAYLKYVELTQL
jgi:enoyl-CoA hydratase/carnithine racemase